MNRRPFLRGPLPARPRTQIAVAAICIAAVLVPATAAASASAPARGTATRFPGVVDVNTNLRYQDSSAAGTGMVLTAAGEVLTNNHVIRGATTIRVTDPSTGHAYPATVVGYARSADVAVLRLTGASHLGTVTIGSSAGVKAGQAVTAVGNARGAGGAPTATTGKVTGLGRTITAGENDGTSERLTGLLRIDATLEPGDSGGPLLDASGRVIGIDTAASRGFAFQAGGEGFAIPIDRALAIVKQIEARRSSATVHIGPTAFLGISVDAAASETVTGAAVAGALPNSPAAKAGIGQGDVVTSLDGRRISSPTRLVDLLLQRSPGQSVRLGWTDQIGGARSATIRLASGPPQ